MPINTGTQGSAGHQPGTPVIGTASAGFSGTASVSFSAPTYLGKPTATTYTATSSPGGVTATGSSSPISFTGLTNGTAYTFTITLSNGVSTSLASSPSNSATPLAPPFFPPFFPPSFGPFFPPSFGPFFPPSFGPYFSACIDEDTLVKAVGVNNSVIFKKAKDLQLGDEIWSANWGLLPSEREADPLHWTGSELANLQLYKSTITNRIISKKDITIYFNDDINSRFSLEHSFLVKRDGIFLFMMSGSIEIGDIIVMNSGDEFKEVQVSTINTIDEERNVYQFDADDYDTIIAGGIITHNAKGDF